MSVASTLYSDWLITSPTIPLVHPTHPKAGASSVHRQEAANRHAPPRTRDDELRILGDTSDPVLPLYRANHTMFTTLFHSDDGRVEIWHGVNPSTAPSDLVFTLQDIFSRSTRLHKHRP